MVKNYIERNIHIKCKLIKLPIGKFLKGKALKSQNSVRIIYIELMMKIMLKHRKKT